jgi:protocatechuate 3,4-dioxygenase beta subunit
MNEQARRSKIIKNMKDLLSRRELLTRGFKTAAALGLGAIAVNAVGDLDFLSSRAASRLSTADLDFVANEPCVLTCQKTLGPCYYTAPAVRRDITEGFTGLPTRMGLRVVNADTCEPVQNAAVDIWHTDRGGSYSAPITTMCSTDPVTRASTAFRGVQPTDANGWAYFDTVFPGWYAGRVTHVHFTVRIGATAMVTSQLFFLDKVSEFIYRSHPLYANRPNRDRTNANDGIAGGLTGVVPYLFSTRLVNNKTLMATKTIAIRTTPTTCNA